jgi:hypothetical protein
LPPSPNPYYAAKSSGQSPSLRLCVIPVQAGTTNKGRVIPQLARRFPGGKLE